MSSDMHERHRKEQKTTSLSAVQFKINVMQSHKKQPSKLTQKISSSLHFEADGQPFWAESGKKQKPNVQKQTQGGRPSASTGWASEIPVDSIGCEDSIGVSIIQIR